MIGTTVKAGIGIVAAIVLAGLAALRIGTSDLSVGTQIQIFTGLVIFGAVLTGLISAVRMTRAAEMPLWTQLDQWGRKQHGFLNWWGTLLALWIVFLLVLFVFVPTLVDATAMLGDMWSAAG
jgi:hypothetical protein